MQCIEKLDAPSFESCGAKKTPESEEDANATKKLDKAAKEALGAK